MASETATSSRGAGSPPPRWMIRGMTTLHLALHRLSGGRWFNSLGGDEVCFVEMTGAKSGRALAIPLVYIPHQDGVLLVASQGGNPKKPAWYFNLVKHPDVTVTRNGQAQRMRARLARSEERPELWPVCETAYAPFAQYRKRTPREIPIFVCEPTP